MPYQTFWCWNIVQEQDHYHGCDELVPCVARSSAAIKLTFILCVSYAVLGDSKFVVTTQCFYILCKVWNIDLLLLCCLLVDVHWYMLIIRVIEHGHLFPLSLTWIMIIKSNHLRGHMQLYGYLRYYTMYFPYYTVLYDCVRCNWTTKCRSLKSFATYLLRTGFDVLGELIWWISV